MITRRMFAAAPLLAVLPHPATLQVGPGDSLRREAALSLAGGAVFTCPARRAKLLGVLRLRATAIAMVGFAADAPQAAQDLVAMIAEDGTLLALERLRWRDRAGRELVTRFAMLPDRVHITLERESARHETTWQRESWTDYLRLVDLRLEDSPPRPVLAGTCQAYLAAQRHANAAAMPRLHGITADLLTSFSSPPFASPAGSG
jgi:hypothetical protein